MIRIALVEDDKNYVAQLREYLEQYEKERGVRISVTEFRDGEDIVTDYRAEYDMILMDIEMTFLDGMTAAERIRKKDMEVIIIFITNMPQYAIQGYRVDALDYVLKPISYFAFSQRIDRAVSRIKKRNREYIRIQMKGGILKQDLSELYYVEVLDHDLIYHTKEGNYRLKGAMKDAEDRLPESRFFRCSRCYLINLEHVDNFKGNDITVGNDLITVSRSRKKALLDALNNYINEAGR